MSSLVKFFAHSGVSTAHVSPGSGRFTTDSIALLRQPYIARQSITANTNNAQSTSTTLTQNAATKLISIEIQAGKMVAVEVNPPNRSAEADSDSPTYSGTVQLECGQNWTFSVKEISVS